MRRSSHLGPRMGPGRHRAKGIPASGGGSAAAIALSADLIDDDVWSEGRDFDLGPPLRSRDSSSKIDGRSLVARSAALSADHALCADNRPVPAITPDGRYAQSVSGEDIWLPGVYTPFIHRRR